MFLSLSALEFAQILVESIEALIPDVAIGFDPVGGYLRTRRLEPAGPGRASTAAGAFVGT